MPRQQRWHLFWDPDFSPLFCLQWRPGLSTRKHSQSLHPSNPSGHSESYWGRERQRDQASEEEILKTTSLGSTPPSIWGRPRPMAEDGPHGDQGQGLALHSHLLWQSTSQRGSNTGLGPGVGGPEVWRRGAEPQMDPFLVPSHTLALYTSLFISVQNHVSILHKEPPSLCPHASALALGSTPRRRGLSEAPPLGPPWLGQPQLHSRENK